MKRNPFSVERRLTPELFDHYVAKARAERGKAIAGFLSATAAWLTGRVRAAAPRPRPGIRDGKAVHSS